MSARRPLRTRGRAIELFPVTSEQAAFIEARVDFLLDTVGARTTLVRLLAEAYHQGLVDTVEMYALRGIEWPAAGAAMPGTGQ